jgi:flavin reductase (DIM6/NTAB) family NADH-FMN oxidoreductase RutF
LNKVNVTLTNPYISAAVADSIVGLTIVKAGSRANAMTVSFFSEVAHHPTSLWVSIAKTSYTHELLQETEQFSLIALNNSQREIALTCGNVSGRDRDKCATLDLYNGPEGYLFLSGALASTACNVREAISIDDHTIFIADILYSEIESRKSYLRQLLLSDLQS